MKIICIGRNYADHAKEMNAPLPVKPVFFMKPDSAILKNGEDFYYPEFTSDLHYECEIVIKIDKVGKNINAKFSHKYYSKVSLGIDFTARDLQAHCKSNGLPWEMAKAFDNSAPISNIWLDKNQINLENLEFTLKKNGTIVQNGNLNQLIFNIDEVIAYVSSFVTLKTGDLIFTGTPSGVGPVQIGDELEGFIENEKMFSFAIK
jgi:2-keto-4-pentenoate hydratase/2-oxohepta-3-ene-1,7-dioic acid hydratase in catechol pathway